MDAYAVERSPYSDEMLRLVAGLQSALTLEEVEGAYLSNVVGVLDADGHGLYRLDPQTLDPVAISTDVTPSFVAKYTEYGRFDDPVMDRARAASGSSPRRRGWSRRPTPASPLMTPVCCCPRAAATRAPGPSLDHRSGRIRCTLPRNWA